METKTNIAELLKDCPQGMELDCTLFEGIEFDSIVDNDCFPIRCRMKNSNDKYNFYSFTKYGYWNDDYRAKCVIFPKGKTTWEGFQRPFKDGDILTTSWGSVFFLNTRLNSGENYGCYVGIGGDGSFHICAPFAYKECCSLATEEEKAKLFQAIKDNGYKWNAKTKTLEKLVEPKFKVGDRIRLKENHNYIYTITDIREEENKYECGVTFVLRFSEQDNWELVPNMFDINTLIPFESRVLVRDFNDDEWWPAIWGVYGYGKEYPHIVVSGNNFIQCIPYEKNEHLLGTKDDCDDYYKTWE